MSNRKVEILGIEDVTENVISVSRNNARASDVAGILAQAKSYVIQDNSGAVSSFSLTGLLSRNVWRAADITEDSDDGNRLFSGQIENTGLIINDAGYQTTIDARDPVAVFLEFPVEELDITTHAGYTVNGAHAIGATSISVTGPASNIVNVPARLTFSDSLVPRYQVVSQTPSAGATITVVLDRGIEEALSGGESIRISIPFADTAPNLLLRAMQSAGLSSRLGSSFSVLNASDVANSLYFWVHVPIEDKISLANYIAQLLELADLNLTLSDAGIIDIVRGRKWDGTSISDRVTSAELIPPVRFQRDSSQLVVGVDYLYRSGSTSPSDTDGATVKVFSKDVDASLVTRFAGVNRHQPISPKTTLIMDYNILYGTEATAEFFADNKLDYDGAPRTNVVANCKIFRNNKPLDLIKPQLYKRFALTVPVSVTRTLFNEPSICVAYNQQPDAFVFQGTWQLTNTPIPNIPRVSDLVSTPEVETSFDIDSGVAFRIYPFTGALKIEVFLSDQSSKLFDSVVTTEDTGDGLEWAVFTNAVLNNGQLYYARLRTVEAPFESERTDFIAFTPQQDVGEYNNGSYNLDSYSVGEE